MNNREVAPATSGNILWLSLVVTRDIHPDVMAISDERPLLKHLPSGAPPSAPVRETTLPRLLFVI